MRFEKVDSAEKLLELLVRHDGSAARTISSRVGDLKQYSEKLFLYAENFTVSDGAGFFSFYGNDTSNHVIYLTLIAVDSELRGQGLGASMLGYLEAFGKQNGRNRIKLEVDKKNHRAIRFYRKNGFQRMADASAESFFMEKEIEKGVLLGEKRIGF